MRTHEKKTWKYSKYVNAKKSLTAQDLNAV